MENNLPGSIEQNNLTPTPTFQVSSQQPDKKQKKYIYILIGVLALAVILVSVFVISKNTLGPKVNEKQSKQSLKPTVKPTLGIPSFTYKIVEGSIYRVSSNGKQELFIDKASLKHTQLTISQIVDFELSPDKSKMVVFAEGGISPLLLFNVDIQTRESSFIWPGVEVTWSPNSRYIAFTCPPADVGPRRLYVFDTAIKDQVSTIQLESKFTDYSNLKWTPDSLVIKADYETRDDMPYGNIIDKGETQIKLK